MGNYPSRYNYSYKINPKYTFINNNLTGAVDIINSDIWDLFLTSDFNKIPNKIVNKLVDRGYLYKNSEEESFVLKKLYSSFLKISKNRSKRLVFCPTYYCNLSCIYCFEKEINFHSSSFNSEVLSSFFNFIKSSKMKFNSIELYGGEPLLPKNKDIISEILLFSEKKNLNISVITNGTYINKYLDLLCRLRKNIEMIQITLDGTKKIHDNRRVFRSGKGSFDLITNNIRLLIDNKINTNLRVNIDNDNIDNIPELYSFVLNNRWLDSSNFDIKLALVTNHKEGGSNFHPEIILEKIIKLYNKNPKLEKLFGFSAFKQLRNILSILNGAKNVAPRFINCETNLLELLIFCQDGYIYTCPESIGNTNLAIGQFHPSFSYFENKKNIWLTKNIFSFTECRNCKFSLICGGGCTYSSLINSNGVIPVCEKYNEVLNTFFKYKGELILNKTFSL